MMPLGSTALLALGGGLWLVLKSKGDKKGKSKDWKDSDYSAMTEIRQTPNGPARFVKESFRSSVAIALLPMRQIKKNSAGNATISVVGKDGVGPFAKDFVAGELEKGNSIAVSLDIWQTPAPAEVGILSIPPNLRPSFARNGKPWAVLADPVSAQVPGSPPIPPVSPIPESPPIPPVSPIPESPPPGLSVPPIPGTPPIPPPIPETPPGLSVPDAECKEIMDAHMPANEKQLACAHLRNEQATIQSLQLAQQACSFRGYPKCAAAFAAEIAGRGNGGTPNESGNTPFKIRSGDYPYALARYYGGKTREILEVNPGMKSTTNSAGVTLYKPWNVGQIVMLPASWNVQTKMLPVPSTQRSSGEPWILPY